MKRRLTIALLTGMLLSSITMIAPLDAEAKRGWHRNGRCDNGWNNRGNNGRHLGWYRNNNWGRWNNNNNWGPRNFNGAWFNRFDNRGYGYYPTYGNYRF